jgi:hypothetical protein
MTDWACAVKHKAFSEETERRIISGFPISHNSSAGKPAYPQAIIVGTVDGD